MTTPVPWTTSANPATRLSPVPGPTTGTGLLWPLGPSPTCGRKLRPKTARMRMLWAGPAWPIVQDRRLTCTPRSARIRTFPNFSSPRDNRALVLKTFTPHPKSTIRRRLCWRSIHRLMERLVMRGRQPSEKVFRDRDCYEIPSDEGALTHVSLRRLKCHEVPLSVPFGWYLIQHVLFTQSREQGSAQADWASLRRCRAKNIHGRMSSQA